MTLRRPPRAAVAIVAAAFLGGCTAVQVQPLPEPPAGPPDNVAGIVVDDGAEGQRIEFQELHQVEWTDSTVVLGGILKGGEPMMRSFPLSSVRGVLVRTVDANRASVVIAVVAVGAIAVAALLLTGKTKEGQPLPGGN